MRVTSFVRLAVFGSFFVSSFAFAQGTAVLTGTVTDAATNKPVADVVVTATSPALQGEEIVVTDATGLYRIPQLPPGSYTLRLEKESYKPFTRGDINLRVDRTIRLNVQVQPESIQAEEVVVVGKAPTVDIGSTTTGMNVGKDFVNNIPFVQPNATGTRDFASLAEVAPQVNGDTYGSGINGTTSPENAIMVDGIAVTDPAYGTNGSNIPVDFIEEVNVVTGGYMPEYGRSTGGVINAVTKSGSNEFHGSVFGNFTPGALTGPRPKIIRESSTFEFENKLWNSGDFGVELGGPILKDRLWFYAGFSPSLSRTRTRRSLYRLNFTDATDCPITEQDDFGNCKEIDPDTLQQSRTELPGATTYRFNDSRAYNYIAKLTFLITPNQNVSLSVSGSPKTTLTPAFNPKSLAGNKTTDDNVDVSLKYQAGFFDKRLLVDATLGWHHQYVTDLPDDGSDIGSTTGAASKQGVIYRKYFAAAGIQGHSILDFENLNPAAAELCTDPMTGLPDPKLCPATSSSQSYQFGGPGYMEKSGHDRIQGKLNFTYLLTALGHHVFKAGIDYAKSLYDITKGYGGGRLLRQSLGGTNVRDYRQYGYFTGPDTFEQQHIDNDPTKPLGVHQAASANETGLFVQDSWNILDMVTLNAGLRYDSQQLYAGDGKLGMSLNNMISPRVGLIYDFTQKGQSKVFASFARYYESVPLDIADRALSGEFQGGFNRKIKPDGNGNGNLGCDPLSDADKAQTDCNDPKNYVTLSSPSDPAQYGLITGAGKSPVDPNLQPQSSDEYLIGGEYEVIQDGRVGASYTHRKMNAVIEDMSRDEASTYFIGNPGYGIASDFPIAIRDYDAVSIYFSKSFSDLWQTQISYTWSSLRGNYAGLFRPETDQLDPNINSDFDLISLLPNRYGPLPGDITHVIKAYGAKEFVINGTFSVIVGAAYTAHSGSPISYLASHPIYGDDETFVLPRGSAGRTPWVHRIDAKLAGVMKISKENSVQLSVDVFNLFNFAAVTAQDQRLSNADLLPYQAAAGEDPTQAACISGDNAGCVSKIRQYSFDASGNPNGTTGTSASDFNQNFKRPTAYQQPLTVRFGVKVTF